MAPKADDYVVDFPTLWIVPDWIERHCIVPDGFGFIRRDPFVLYDYQLWCTVNHYRVKPSAKVGQLAPAFHNRRSQIIAPQKIGKGPWSATIVAAEAVGPTLFAGWAGNDDSYECSDHGCGCGWEYAYEPGEPMGMPWPTPLIQITAYSQDQTDNVYLKLQSMIRGGPLADMMKVREGFIRTPNGGRIDVVTSNAQSRLGNPITFALQDETGIWLKANGMQTVATTQRRGLAGMGGRSMETTNAPNPAEDSVAQRTMESQRPDIFKYHRLPPASLKYKNKTDRRKIHRYVYSGAKHVDLDSIEAEAAEILEKDPAEAERFFGNRTVSGADVWLDVDVWDTRAAPREVDPKQPIVGGFDGSDSDDWTGIRLETLDGYQFTPKFADGKPMIWDPKAHGGEIPRLEVSAAWAEINARYNLVRSYNDPPLWQTEIDTWANLYGEKVFISWPTYRPVPMAAALERLHTDITQGNLAHDGCEITRTHVRNARRVRRRVGEKLLILISKDRPLSPNKIDMTMSSALAHECAGDALAAGLDQVDDTDPYIYFDEF